MEILSIGEKIKRTRIYREVTLKELCGNKLSMSKLSCIENNKVEPSSDILEYIADKLDVDLNYLEKDIRRQIADNIEEIKGYSLSRVQEIEDMLLTNLEYAKEYKYVDLCSQLIHMLFNTYIKTGNLAAIQKLLPEYYEIYEADTKIEQTYYRDMALYFFLENEYLESLTYLKKIQKTADVSINEMTTIKTYESMCLSKLGLHNKAMECIEEMMKSNDEITDLDVEGFLYAEYFYLDVIINNIINVPMMDNAMQKFGDNKNILSLISMKISEAFYCNRDYDKSIQYAKKALEEKPEDKTYENQMFFIRIADILMNCGEIDTSSQLIDHLLDNAINSDNIMLIERAYYYKSEMCKLKKDNRQWELYKSLSLDSLDKFGTPKQKYDRYIEMADMNYKLENFDESVKYMMLANEIKIKL